MANNRNKEPYYIAPAIEVKQPLGTFFVFKIKASKIVKISFSISAYSQNGKLSGLQRKLKDDRVKKIALYSSSTIATFPNSIILSANFDEFGRFVESSDLRWRFENGNIVIPECVKLASIIDGQHRIEGLKEAITKGTFEDFDILCSVYIDLDFSRQAEVFTSINYNQKKVDKSIAYELFGYDLDDSDDNNWSPDTLAVYFARVLNKDSESPLRSRIFTSFDGADKNDNWFVSTACIVECICLLLTNDATKDRYTIHQRSLFGASGRKRLVEIKSNAPLRRLFIEKRDKDIFDIVFTFLKKVDSLSWFSNPSYVTTKTIGFIAMFEFLKDLLIDKSLEELRKEDLYFLDNISLDKLHKDSFSFSGIGKAQVKALLVKSWKNSD